MIVGYTKDFKPVAYDCGPQAWGNSWPHDTAREFMGRDGGYCAPHEFGSMEEANLAASKRASEAEVRAAA